LERIKIGVEKMYLFDLGERPWEQSMLIFHAFARMGSDFTLYPKNKLRTLESSLKGTEREKSELTSKIEEFYEEADVQTPGVKAKDFTKAIMEANKI